jgi:hypothetical protein
MAEESGSVKRILWFSVISLICSVARSQGVGGNGVPGAGSGSASIPATSNLLKGAGSAGSATAATPGTDYMTGVPATAAGQVPVATGPGGVYSAQTLTYNNVGASPGVTPLTFGGYGDAYQPPNGCNTTASSTTVVCVDGPFVSTDVGKQIWVSGVGAAGAAFNATITAVTNASTVTVSAAATGAVTNGRGIYGHDDRVAVQACFQYSAANAVACVLKTLPSPGLGLVGYLIGSGGLQFVSNNALEENSGPNIVGNSQVNGTNLFCEFNGDCISLATGAIQGVNISNISIEEDHTQPASRGIHLNPSGGPFTNSNFNNITVDNPALECLWMDGGGGPGYAFNLPNQFLTFSQFFCQGPNQMHTSSLIKMTGQTAQVIFINGAASGQYPYTNYPNSLILSQEKTGGLGDSPSHVKFLEFTYQVGTQGLYIGEGSSSIHFDDGYIENVASPYVAYNANGLTFNGNHIANSGNVGAVVQAQGLVNGSVRDNFVYGSVALPAAFAVCLNNSNTVDLAQNTSTVTTTTSCGTSQIGPTTSTLTVAGGNTEFVNGSATTITTINAPGISPGKTLTLYAASSPGITLGSGGNINFGGLTSPLTIPAGQNVTLTLFDLGPTWLITSTTAVTASVPSLNSTFFDDFYTGANMASVAIGSPVGSSCSPNNTYTDNNHPGNMLLTAGTGGTGTGILCGLVSEANSVTSANTSLGWTWETAVYVPVLPGTTAAAYQAGLAHTPNANPWTTGIGFYLSSANGVANDWYCRYNSTSTDSGVAATVAWTRLTMVNDGTNVHWYIGGTQVCGTGVAIASMPSTTQYPAVWSATALSATSVTMAYDYINWQRAVSR